MSMPLKAICDRCNAHAALVDRVRRLHVALFNLVDAVDAEENGGVDATHFAACLSVARSALEGD